MGDATGDLSERPQTFLLHRGLLTAAQVVIGYLQRVVQLSLARRERDVLTELLEELAVGTAECVDVLPGRDQNTEESSLRDQWCDHHGAEATARQVLQQRQGDLLGIGLMNQLSGSAG